MSNYVATHDIDAEEAVVRSLLFPPSYQVFDEIYFNVKPEFFAGSELDRKSELLCQFFQLIVGRAEANLGGNRRVFRCMFKRQNARIARKKKLTESSAG